MIRFAQPWAFLLLLAVPVILYLMRRARGKSTPKMPVSSLGLLGEKPQRNFRLFLRPVPRIFSLVALVLLIAAFARPQVPWRDNRRKVEGIDIMLVCDVSESMRALDFTPYRLAVAKEVMKEFVAGRDGDQIGVVIFGKETFTLCPLTHDYSALMTFIDRIDFDLVNGQATAIGMGLANAVNKLRDSPAKSKVIILLTDGEDNAGSIKPLDAGILAKEMNCRVYTIGIGRKGGPPVQIPVKTGNGFTLQYSQSNMDTDTLTKIAEDTGGLFFEAANGEKLKQIFDQIDKLETTEFNINETNYYDELAHMLLLPALLLFGLAFFLEQTWLWSFP
jgi:Ca-activated chloride channel family protein